MAFRVSRNPHPVPPQQRASILAKPGFGRYFVLAVGARDYPVIIGTTLVYAVFVVGINLLVDLSYLMLDPRVRLSSPR